MNVRGGSAAKIGLHSLYPSPSWRGFRLRRFCGGGVVIFDISVQGTSPRLGLCVGFSLSTDSMTQD